MDTITEKRMMDSESDSDTEVNSSEEDSDEPRQTRMTRGRGAPSKSVRNNNARKRVSSDDESTAESTSESDTSEDEETEDEDDSERDSDSDGSEVKSKRTTRKGASKDQASRRTSQRPKRSPVLLDEFVKSERSKRNTRNQGRRTVRYDENSDDDAQLIKEAEEDSEATDDYSDPENAPTTVSSRGRVRKMTAKARASFMSVS